MCTFLYAFAWVNTSVYKLFFFLKTILCVLLCGQIPLCSLLHCLLFRGQIPVCFTFVWAKKLCTTLFSFAWENTSVYKPFCFCVGKHQYVQPYLLLCGQIPVCTTLFAFAWTNTIVYNPICFCVGKYQCTTLFNFVWVNTSVYNPFCFCVGKYQCLQPSLLLREQIPVCTTLFPLRGKIPVFTTVFAFRWVNTSVYNTFCFCVSKYQCLQPFSFTRFTRVRGKINLYPELFHGKAYEVRGIN